MLAECFDEGPVVANVCLGHLIEPMLPALLRSVQVNHGIIIMSDRCASDCSTRFLKLFCWRFRLLYQRWWFLLLAIRLLDIGSVSLIFLFFFFILFFFLLFRLGISVARVFVACLLLLRCLLLLCLLVFPLFLVIILLG